MSAQEKIRILIPYYSAYGHTLTMARAVAQGVQEEQQAEVKIVKIREFEEVYRRLSEEEHGQRAHQEQASIPVATHEDLVWADAIIWGIPTRFGSMPAQMKHFLESANELWFEGALEGKPTAVFTSTGHIHGGQETTMITSFINLLHFGMIIVGLPHTENPEYLTTEAIGGSAYGASTVAGVQGEQQPDERDLKMAFRLGRRVTSVAKHVKPIRNSH